MAEIFSKIKTHRSRAFYFGMIVLFASILFIIGIKTDVFLGDEVHHYRFAKDSYELGRRAIYDTLYGPVIPPGYLYSTEPLWPLGLAVFWKVFGGLSPFSAQLYQTIFFILFIASIFLLARDLYGEECALHASFVAATMPMVTAFGILFYIDMPAAALCTFLFLLLYRERYFFAGVMLGLFYLTKRSGAFFVPAIFLWILFYSSLSFLKKFRALFVCFTASFFTVLPDILWRRQHFFTPIPSIPPEQGAKKALALESAVSHTANSLNFAMSQSSSLFRQKLQAFTSWKFWEIKEYLNSSLLHPKDMIAYFGVSFLFLFLVYFLKRKYSPKDRFLWIPIVVYMVAFTFVFHLASDIRYIFPIVPLLIILAAKSFEAFKTPWFKRALFAICFLQFIFVSFFVYNARHPSQELKEGFLFIRHNIPAQSVVLYPEGNLLEEANRKVLWGLGGILNIFWVQDENEVIPLIQQNRLEYIIVKKNRVYEDDHGKIRHHGGYPRSFVNRLPQFSFTEKIFENSEMSVWKIDPKLILS